jgi:hypothetical protein
MKNITLKELSVNLDEELIIIPSWNKIVRSGFLFNGEIEFSMRGNKIKRDDIIKGKIRIFLPEYQGYLVCEFRLPLDGGDIVYYESLLGERKDLSDFPIDLLKKFCNVYTKKKD